jgi:HK97 family phage major capsid protein
MVVKNYRGGGYEQEVSEATIKKYGGNRQGHGIAIPPEVFFYRADPILSTPKPGNAAQTGGANLVGTDTMGSEFIRAFWERLVIGRAGARFMRGLVGNVVIPKQTGKAKAQWVAEGVAPTGSQQTFGQVPMAPKRIADFIDISRLNLLQSSIDMEAFIREDLQAAVAAAVDAAAIYGSGQNLEPRGILNHPDVDVAVDLGADALQFEDIIDMETAVAENNADVDAMVYITNARVRGYLKAVPEAPLTSKMIWTSSGGGEGIVNGYRALASNHVPSNLGTGKNLSAMVFGNFRDLIIGQWGALFLQENPYLNQSAGLVRIDIEQQMDLILRHGESFSAIKTIDTTKRPSFLKTVGSTAEGGTEGGGTRERRIRRSKKVTDGNDEE